MAVLVTKKGSTIIIYTDSQSIIDKFTFLYEDHNRFSSLQGNFKLQYYKYWSILFYILDSLQLKINLKKVRAYRENRFNEEADRLAKVVLKLNNILIINTDIFAHVSIANKNQGIVDNLRRFIKTIFYISRFF